MKQIMLKSVCPQRLYVNKDNMATLYIAPLYSDFYNECKRYAIMNVHALEKGAVFPIRGSVSIMIRVLSSKPVNLVGMAKPILDSMIGILISDDSIVSTIFIEQQRTRNPIDNIEITVYNGVSLTLEDYKNDLKRKYVILNYTFDTVVEDNPVPYPEYTTDYGHDYCATVIKNDREVTINSDVLYHELFRGYRIPLRIRAPNLISVEYNTLIPKTDPDNVALIVMTALSKKIKRITRTRSLYIHKTGISNQESVRIKIK